MTSSLGRMMDATCIRVSDVVMAGRSSRLLGGHSSALDEGSRDPMLDCTRNPP